MVNYTNNELLVLDIANFRMVRIDLNSKKVTASVKVGRQPFGLGLSPDKKQAFVANVGLYEYPLIVGATPENINDLLISHHPYGHNTPESINGTLMLKLAMNFGPRMEMIAVIALCHVPSRKTNIGLTKLLGSSLRKCLF